MCLGDTLSSTDMSSPTREPPGIRRSISEDDARRILSKNSAERSKEESDGVQQYLAERASWLAQLTPEALRSLLPRLNLTSVPKDTWVCRQGQAGDSLHVVFSGCCAVYHKGRDSPTSAPDDGSDASSDDSGKWMKADSSLSHSSDESTGVQTDSDARPKPRLRSKSERGRLGSFDRAAAQPKRDSLPHIKRPSIARVASFGRTTVKDEKEGGSGAPRSRRDSVAGPSSRTEGDERPAHGLKSKSFHHKRRASVARVSSFRSGEATEASGGEGDPKQAKQSPPATGPGGRMLARARTFTDRARPPQGSPEEDQGSDAGASPSARLRQPSLRRPAGLSRAKSFHGLGSKDLGHREHGRGEGSGGDVEDNLEGWDSDSSDAAQDLLSYQGNGERGRGPEEVFGGDSCSEDSNPRSSKWSLLRSNLKSKTFSGKLARQNSGRHAYGQPGQGSIAEDGDGREEAPPDPSAEAADHTGDSRRSNSTTSIASLMAAMKCARKLSAGIHSSFNRGKQMTGRRSVVRAVERPPAPPPPHVSEKGCSEADRAECGRAGDFLTTERGEGRLAALAEAAHRTQEVPEDAGSFHGFVRPGGHFGEASLQFEGAARVISVLACVDCEVLVVDRAGLAAAVGHLPPARVYAAEACRAMMAVPRALRPRTSLNKLALHTASMPVFRDLDYAARLKLVGVMLYETHEARQQMTRQGYMGSSMYLILQGHCSVHVRDDDLPVDGANFSQAAQEQDGEPGREKGRRPSTLDVKRASVNNAAKSFAKRTGDEAPEDPWQREERLRRRARGGEAERERVVPLTAAAEENLGPLVKTLQPGEGFGELALVMENLGLRFATVVTRAPCAFIKLQQVEYTAIVGTSQREHYLKQLAFLRKVDILRKVSEDKLLRMQFFLQPQQHSRGHVVFREGESIPGLFITKTGAVKLLHHLGDAPGPALRGAASPRPAPTAAELAIVGPYGIFGEEIFLDLAPNTTAAPKDRASSYQAMTLTSTELFLLRTQHCDVHRLGQATLEAATEYAGMRQDFFQRSRVQPAALLPRKEAKDRSPVTSYRASPMLNTAVKSLSNSSDPLGMFARGVSPQSGERAGEGAGTSLRKSLRSKSFEMPAAVAPPPLRRSPGSMQDLQAPLQPAAPAAPSPRTDPQPQPHLRCLRDRLASHRSFNTKRSLSAARDARSRRGSLSPHARSRRGSGSRSPGESSPREGSLSPPRAAAAFPTPHGAQSLTARPAVLERPPPLDVSLDSPSPGGGAVTERTARPAHSMYQTPRGPGRRLGQSSELSPSPGLGYMMREPGQDTSPTTPRVGGPLTPATPQSLDSHLRRRGPISPGTVYAHSPADSIDSEGSMVAPTPRLEGIRELPSRQERMGLGRLPSREEGCTGDPARSSSPAGSARGPGESSSPKSVQSDTSATRRPPSVFQLRVRTPRMMAQHEDDAAHSEREFAESDRIRGLGERRGSLLAPVGGSYGEHAGDGRAGSPPSSARSSSTSTSARSAASAALARSHASRAAGRARLSVVGQQSERSSSSSRPAELDMLMDHVPHHVTSIATDRPMRASSSLADYQDRPMRHAGFQPSSSPVEATPLSARRRSTYHTSPPLQRRAQSEVGYARQDGEPLRALSPQLEQLVAPRGLARMYHTSLVRSLDPARGRERLRRAGMS